MLTSLTICVLTLEKIQASGRGMSVLGHFPCYLASGHWKGLPICAGDFSLRWVGASQSPRKECFAEQPQSMVLVPVVWKAEASGCIQVPGAYSLWKEHIGGDLLPGTLMRLLLSPPTLSQLVVFGAVLTFPRKWEKNLDGPILWVFSNLTDEFSKTCKWVQEILTYLLPF